MAAELGTDVDAALQLYAAQPGMWAVSQPSIIRDRWVVTVVPIPNQDPGGAVGGPWGRQHSSTVQHCSTAGRGMGKMAGWAGRSRKLGKVGSKNTGWGPGSAWHCVRLGSVGMGGIDVCVIAAVGGRRCLGRDRDLTKAMLRDTTTAPHVSAWAPHADLLRLAPQAGHARGQAGPAAAQHRGSGGEAGEGATGEGGGAGPEGPERKGPAGRGDDEAEDAEWLVLPKGRWSTVEQAERQLGSDTLLVTGTARKALQGRRMRSLGHRARPVPAQSCHLTSPPTPLRRPPPRPSARAGAALGDPALAHPGVPARCRRLLRPQRLRGGGAGNAGAAAAGGGEAPAQAERGG